MGSNKFSLHGAVYLLFEKDNNILLLRRFNTGWEDGKYTLPAGHFDGGETVLSAAIREAKEETGVELSENDLEIIHVLHIKTNLEYISYFIKVKNWTGTPINTEPDKCDDMQWFSIDKLPDNTLPFIHKVLENYKKGVMFSEEGFKL
jgi:ADP-ribose pyrophosphatase YjhB (NUDIX family)